MTLENGFVKISGASDLEDSSMAAGLCVLFDYPLTIDLNNYLDEHLMYRRCKDSKYSFSRDQAVCLVAGYWKQARYDIVDANKINGKDILSPAVKGHIQRCKGLKSAWFQDSWLWLELWFSAKCKPLDELNQLFAMMMVADKKYIKWYVKANPQWQDAVHLYWCGWRNEPEFAKLMIDVICAAVA